MAVVTSACSATATEAIIGFSGCQMGQVSHANCCPNKGTFMRVWPAGEGAVVPAGCITKDSPEYAAIVADKGYALSSDACYLYGPLYVKKSHEGLVVALREMNGCDDSDFYAVVYNPDTDDFSEICYASTRGWTYQCGASIDAPAEIIKLYYDRQRDTYEAAARRSFEAKKAKEAATPYPGRMVTVVRGRKVPKGTVGEVFWFKDTQYGLRVGLKDSEGTVHWTAAANVEVNQPVTAG